MQLLVALALFASTAKGPSRCVPILPASVSPYGLQLLPNIVSLRSRELRWNGMRIDERRLSILLRSAKKLNPLPSLLFKSNYADCAFAHHIERLLKGSYPCSGNRCSQVTTR